MPSCAQAGRTQACAYAAACCICTCPPAHTGAAAYLYAARACGDLSNPAGKHVATICTAHAAARDAPCAAASITANRPARDAPSAASRTALCTAIRTASPARAGIQRSGGAGFAAAHASCGQAGL